LDFYMPKEQREKNPRHVAAGRTAALKRWGPRRHVRLNELNPEAAAIVRALIAADEAAKQAAKS
jgi:hypothetical protein